MLSSENDFNLVTQMCGVVLNQVIVYLNEIIGHDSQFLQQENDVKFCVMKGWLDILLTK